MIFFSVDEVFAIHLVNWKVLALWKDLQDICGEYKALHLKINETIKSDFNLQHLVVLPKYLHLRRLRLQVGAHMQQHSSHVPQWCRQLTHASHVILQLDLLNLAMKRQLKNIL